MKYKTLPLALAAILLASLAIVGCGPGAAEFVVSNLTISPGTVEVGEAVAISVDVENIGGVEGNYTVTVTAGDETLTEDVTLAGGATETVTFAYSPGEAGSYTVTVGELSDTFLVTPPAEAYWRIPYRTVGGGGELTLFISLYQLDQTIMEKPVVPFPATTMEVWINKTVVDGSREVIIPAATFLAEPAFVPDVQVGIDMDLTLSLTDDAIGTLYVEDDAGDVDVTSETAAGRTPQTEYTFGDGTLDPAGSLLIDMPLFGDALTTIAQRVTLPMPVYMTTEHSYNSIAPRGKPMDGSEQESDGVSFAEDGGLAPYVGTSGTIVCTGGLLGRTFVGFGVDFQFRIVMEIEPE